MTNGQHTPLTQPSGLQPPAGLGIVPLAYCQATRLTQCKPWPFTPQKATFRIVKGYLSQHETRHIRKALTISRLAMRQHLLPDNCLHALPWPHTPGETGHGKQAETTGTTRRQTPYGKNGHS